MKPNRNSNEKDNTNLSKSLLSALCLPPYEIVLLPSSHIVLLTSYFTSRDGSELFWRESAWFLLGQKCDQRKRFLDLEKPREHGKKWNGQRD
jgi:hypothetical protein